MPDPGSPDLGSPVPGSVDAIDAFLDTITLHVDADVRVIDKPSGLAVAAGTRTTDHLDGMLMARADAGHERLRLVHRLDRDTSGCLVLAATRDAARLLGREMMARRVVKVYWALVHGVPVFHSGHTGTIDVPLIKARGSSGDRVRAALPGEIADAWPAVTHYEVLDAATDRSSALVQLTPLTGRQHQLRAHLAHIGHPIVGCDKYPFRSEICDFRAPDQPCRLHLLARRLTFRHPRGHILTIAASVPPHMRASFERLGIALPPELRLES